MEEKIILLSGDSNKRDKLSFFVELFGFNWEIIAGYMNMDEDECLEYFRETKVRTL